MSRRSAHTVTFRDLVNLAEQSERDTARRLAGARSRGVGNMEALTHAHETAKAMVRLLKKWDRSKPLVQTDLFALFEQTR
jgi:hypothetical protein